MHGPMSQILSMALEGLERDQVTCHWEQGPSYLYRVRTRYHGNRGDIICYNNPPVHQVGNPGLDAYLEALEAVSTDRGSLDFLILCGANDPVHAGGDLKETLGRLDATLERKRELLARNASAEEIYALFHWGDERLKKGLALFRLVRGIAQDMRVVAVCGGGTRYGGSAEVALMADVILGDSRSGMCFSEVLIGLIPGWGGIGRAITKAGKTNARALAETGREAKAADLLAMGVYNKVVDVSEPLPRMVNTGDREKDRREYAEALERNNDATTARLLPEALDLAVTPGERIPGTPAGRRMIVASEEETSGEVLRRKDPQRYTSLWGKPLREVAAEIAEMGRPLAPQSVDAMERLFETFDETDFDEDAFVEQEMYADAALYRDPRFRSGILATLEQKVADFREE